MVLFSDAHVTKSPWGQGHGLQQELVEEACCLPGFLFPYTHSFL